MLRSAGGSRCCTRREAGALSSECGAVQDFLRNNRGINDGGDLPIEFMEDIYERIVNNEIKMKVRACGLGPLGFRALGPCNL